MELLNTILFWHKGKVGKMNAHPHINNVSVWILFYPMSLQVKILRVAAPYCMRATIQVKLPSLQCCSPSIQVCRETGEFYLKLSGEKRLKRWPLNEGFNWSQMFQVETYFFIVMSFVYWRLFLLSLNDFQIKYRGILLHIKINIEKI